MTELKQSQEQGEAQEKPFNQPIKKEVPMMQSNELSQGVAESTREGGCHFRLSQREHELLEFILDQKFAGTQTLYYRFYQGEGSKGPRYAQERLRLLEKGGLLKAVRIVTERENSYLVTDQGQGLIQGRHPERLIQEPAGSIDLRSFEHDRRVSLCRAVREKEGSVTAWRSERRLKQEFAHRTADYRIAREFMPDAIFTNQKGGQVAFELELSPKTRERYAKKITRFVEVMRSGAAPPGLFSRVLYVPCSKSVQDTLCELTRPYGELFRVLPFTELVPKVLFSGGLS
jgi:hypothetical protein